MVTVMIKIKFILFLLFMLTSNAFSSVDTDNSVSYVSDLILKIPFSKSQVEKDEILNEINKIKNKNPSNKNIFNMYINALVSNNKYSQALLELDNLKEENQNDELYLLKCMLKDRLGKISNECYKSFIKTKKQHNKKDTDYIMALYLSGSDKYKQEKEEYIKNSKLPGDFDLIEGKKPKEILLEFFP